MVLFWACLGVGALTVAELTRRTLVEDGVSNKAAVISGLVHGLIYMIIVYLFLRLFF